MVAAPQFNDPKYLHRRAKKARAHAKEMRNERHKKMMREIANEYDDAAAKAVLLAIAESLMRFRWQALPDSRPGNDSKESRRFLALRV
jgi:hypothetical protein